MTTKQSVCSVDELEGLRLGSTVVWGSRGRVETVLKYVDGVRIARLEDAGDSVDTLIVVGGGTRIDTAKIWRAEHRPALCLVAIPSVWGSGAEATNIVVRNAKLRKEILIGDQYLPDIRCVIPELMDSLPEESVRYACGDAWSHALEGFLSPLADESVRKDLCDVLRAMSELSLEKNPDWFELSARACQGQAKSSVGLVHGIAHTLEGPLQIEYPDRGWGHARLCSLFLYPVALFNSQASDRFDTLLDEYGLDSKMLTDKIRALFSSQDYELALPLLNKYWAQVIRDPCTRTNSALVRPKSLAFFSDWALL